MGMGLEWIAEHYYNVEEEMQRIEDEAKHGVWTTNNGEQIPVEDMTTRHIQNTIAYIKRVDEIDMYLPWVKVFETELTRRER